MMTTIAMITAAIIFFLCAPHQSTGVFPNKNIEPPILGIPYRTRAITSTIIKPITSFL
jgi:hypothetical protein